MAVRLVLYAQNGMNADGMATPALLIRWTGWELISAFPKRALLLFLVSELLRFLSEYFDKKGSCWLGIIDISNEDKEHIPASVAFEGQYYQNISATLSLAISKFTNCIYIQY